MVLLNKQIERSELQKQKKRITSEEETKTRQNRNEFLHNFTRDARERNTIAKLIVHSHHVNCYSLHTETTREVKNNNEKKKQLSTNKWWKGVECANKEGRETQKNGFSLQVKQKVNNKQFSVLWIEEIYATNVFVSAYMNEHFYRNDEIFIMCIS